LSYSGGCRRRHATRRHPSSHRRPEPTEPTSGSRAAGLQSCATDPWTARVMTPVSPTRRGALPADDDESLGGDRRCLRARSPQTPARTRSFR